MTNQNPEQEPVIDPAAFEGRFASTGEVAEAAAEDSAAASAADGTAAEDVLADAISAELAERTSDLQRLTAEYANYRRRVERDRKATIDNAKAQVVGELLAVLDDLDRARAHGDLESGPLKGVADKLVTALEKQGLVEFGSEGEPFDPTLHEAVQHEGSGHDPVIGMVMRKGYRFGERVLRHALVGVTDGVADLAADSGAAQADSTNAGTDAAGAE
ncbi:nucleotide exchange factor GrpE [Nocardia sp. NPDC051030]|uniref:nucleotide exchange factor GrpE n=1 Tax=Nocardia sp. NPDC051030 TaxID=3155162 RepID=UPI00343D2B32